MKPFIALLGFLWAFPIIADEAPTDTTPTTETVASTVRDRLSCDELTTKISELSAITEPDTVTIDELTSYKAEYRRNCTKALGGRRTNSVRTASSQQATPKNEPTDAVETTIVSQQEPTPETEQVLDTKPELTAEQIAENINAGLCADGSEPNKFGCCGDEKFKDLGNTIFACCPPDGGDCFPPITK